MTQKLAVAEEDGFAEVVHLHRVQRVVDVVFAGDPPAGRGQERGQRVANRRIAPARNGHGAIGVDRDELDHDAFAGVGVRLPKRLAFGSNSPQDVAEPAGPQAQVQEARSGDFDALNERIVANRQVADDFRGHVTRGHPGALGKGQRHTRRPVAVGTVFGHFQRDSRRGQVAWQVACGFGIGKGLFNKL